MPELPEVETIVRSLRSAVEGRAIRRFTARWARQVRPGIPAVRRGICGKRIKRLGRRGKFLVFELEPEGFLLVHLKMSGRLELLRPGQPEPSHVRAVFELDGGKRLVFRDARKFGRITYTRDLAAAATKLGIEPLGPEFTAARLATILSGRKRRLKPLLLDQSVIAGLGNIYTDEALFRAGLHPLAISSQVPRERVRTLRAAIQAALRDGIRRSGASFDWVYPGGRMQEIFRVYGRTGEPCLKCGAGIQYLRVGQRGTHVCPRCQPIGTLESATSASPGRRKASRLPRTGARE